MGGEGTWGDHERRGAQGDDRARGQQPSLLLERCCDGGIEGVVLLVVFLNCSCLAQTYSSWEVLLGIDSLVYVGSHEEMVCAILRVAGRRIGLARFRRAFWRQCPVFLIYRCLVLWLHPCSLEVAHTATPVFSRMINSMIASGFFLYKCYELLSNSAFQEISKDLRKQK